MKIYTKTGDKGETSLLYGTRVKKSNLRVEAYGTCDEANSSIGMALSFLTIDNEEIQRVFHQIQTTLFHVGAMLATPDGKKLQWTITEADIEFLEQAIDRWDAKLPPLQNFILPGGTQSGATLHVARTITRRAERIAVDIEGLEPLVIKYLNRLSDFLFVAARYVNALAGEREKTLHEE